jgi:hypothetical protein
MSLPIPSIVYSYSPWSRQLYVNGIVRGAIVTVTAKNPAGDRTIVQTGPLTFGGEVLVDLIAGEAIQADDQLFIKQSTATDGSNVTPINKATRPIALDPNPDRYGKVGVLTRLIQCGEAIWITGVVPGAEVQVVQGGTLLAKKLAPAGFVRVSLTSRLSASGPALEIRQAQPVAPFKIGSTVSEFPVEKIDAVLKNVRELPRLKYQAAPRACDVSIPIGNVVGGATVTLTASFGTRDAVFDRDQLYFLIGQKLKPGDRLKVQQSLCKEFKSPVEEITVAADTPLPQVGVAHVCSDGAQCTLYNLHPGAEVEIKTGAETSHIGIALNKTTYTGDLGIPISGGSIEVVQFLPGCPASRSAPTTFTLQVLANTTPVIRQPIFACAKQVRLSGVTLFNQIEILDAETQTLLSAPRVTAFTTIPILDVTTLRANQAILVRSYACDKVMESEKVQVKSAPTESVKPTITEPVDSTANSIKVNNPIPFSKLIVEVERTGSGLIEPAIKPQELVEDVETVKLIVKLEIGDKLNAKLEYCGVMSRVASAIVKRPPPQPPTINKPAENSNAISGLTVEWADPGALSDAKADSFMVEIQPAGIMKMGLTTTSFAIPGALKLSTTYTVIVTAFNPSGSNKSSKTFKTIAPTKPTVQLSRVGQDIAVKVTGCAPSTSVILTGKEEHGVNQPNLSGRNGSVTVSDPASRIVARVLIEQKGTSSVSGEALFTITLDKFDFITLKTQKGSGQFAVMADESFKGLFKGSTVTIKANYTIVNKDMTKIESPPGESSLTWDGDQPTVV